MKAIVVPDEAAGTAGMSVVEHREPQAVTRSNLAGTDRSLSEDTADVIEATGLGLRALELALIVLAGLIVTPFLGVIVVSAAVPAAAILALVATIAAPVMLVRRVLAHHRTHKSTLLLHRLSR